MPVAACVYIGREAGYEQEDPNTTILRVCEEGKGIKQSSTANHRYPASYRVIIVNAMTITQLPTFYEHLDETLQSGYVNDQSSEIPSTQSGTLESVTHTFTTSITQSIVSQLKAAALNQLLVQ